MTHKHHQLFIGVNTSQCNPYPSDCISPAPPAAPWTAAGRGGPLSPEAKARRGCRTGGSHVRWRRSRESPPAAGYQE